MFYYCTNLSELYLNAPPTLKRPEGKEGLWFERVTKMIIHIPSRKVYDEFMKVENCGSVDWSAFNFVADNGDKLPAIQQAAEYNDSGLRPITAINFCHILTVQIKITREIITREIIN